MTTLCVDEAKVIINNRLEKIKEITKTLDKELSDITKIIMLFDDLGYGFINPPIVGGSTVLFKDTKIMLSGKNEFTYGVRDTPIIRDLCMVIDILEKSKGTILTPSGLSALTFTFLFVLKPGDHILVVDTVYEPVRDFCEKYLKSMNVSVDYYDPADENSIKSLIRDTTKLVHLESPGSGTFEIQDVKSICDFVHKKNPKCLISMDNTWSTPFLFKPLLHGVDLSVHALTKYPSGNSDLTMGSISTSELYYKNLINFKNTFGFCGSSSDSYTILKGFKNLKIRLDNHHNLTLKVIDLLKNTKMVTRILCPAVPEFPYYKLWKRDYTRTNSILSFVLDCKKINNRLIITEKFLNYLKIFGLGWSWGGYRSLAATVKTSHRLYSPIYEGPIIRLQIGFEDIEDLLWDLEKSFKNL